MRPSLIGLSLPSLRREIASGSVQLRKHRHAGGSPPCSCEPMSSPMMNTKLGRAGRSAADAAPASKLMQVMAVIAKARDRFKVIEARMKEWVRPPGELRDT